MALADERPELKEKLYTILKNKSITNEPLGIDFDKARFALDFTDLGYDEVQLEIGSGWGEYTLECAAQNPKILYIALEKKKKRVVACIKEQKKRELKNIRWMIIDIKWFFEGIFKKGTFSKVTINFPDPWPKLRHHKNRFIDDNFIDTLSDYLAQDSVIEFATDHWPYLEDVLWILEAKPYLRNLNGRGVALTEVAGRAKSYFEQLKKDEGCDIYFLQFQK